MASSIEIDTTLDAGIMGDIAVGERFQERSVFVDGQPLLS